MNAIKSTWVRAVVLACGLAAGVTAQAASTWQFSGAGTYNSIGEEYAKSGVYTGADANLSISGVYVANDASGVANGSKFNTGTGSSPLYFGGNGLGMCSDPVSPTSCPASNPPNHAIDNVGNTEGILMSFTTKVALQQIFLGFVSNDADISVFRYTGSSAPANLNTVDGSAAGLTGAGWQLVGNYADVAQDTNPAAPNQNINASGLTSSWWLIMAYNSGLAGTSKASGTSLSNNDDYFKIFAVAGTACSTQIVNGQCANGGGKLPEPATLALTSVALIGVAGLRRRQSVKRQA
ncbi:MAG: PEP-CTERM sorting domain-containing protein [Burkholderiales bacterium]|nr:MAG: PEP-CTERM sorting domain-containing protein [Burkholderiales bacterium]